MLLPWEAELVEVYVPEAIEMGYTDKEAALIATERDTEAAEQLRSDFEDEGVAIELPERVLV